MNTEKNISGTKNSKGAAIFKIMLEDKNAIHDHLIKAGKISTIKGKFNFVKTLSITGKR